MAYFQGIVESSKKQSLQGNASIVVYEFFWSTEIWRVKSVLERYRELLIPRCACFETVLEFIESTTAVGRFENPFISEKRGFPSVFICIVPRVKKKDN